MRKYSSVITLFALTFLTRIFFIYVLRIFLISDMLPNPGYAPDFFGSYDAMAQNILAGNGFSISPGYPADKIVPLYPLFLSLVYSIAGNTKAVIHPVLAMLDGLSAVIIYSLARKLFDHRVAIISGLAFALYPPFIYLTSTASSEILYLPLHLLFAYFLIDVFQGKSLRASILCGVFWGLSGLCRPVAIGLPIFILIGACIFYYRNPDRGMLKQFAVLFLAMFITVLPWTIRNYSVFHKFYLLNASFARVSTNLYFGSLEEQSRPDPQSERSNVFWKHVQEKLSDSQDRRPIHEVYDTGSEALLGSYIKEIREDPLTYAKFLFIKFMRFWYGTESGRLERPLMIFQGLVALLGVMGMGFCSHLYGWRKILPLLIILLYYPVLHILTLPLARYSMPIMPFFLLFGVYGVINLRESFKTYHPRLLWEHYTRQ